MTWVAVRFQKDLEVLADFLLPWEDRGVNFTSLVFEGTAQAHKPRQTKAQFWVLKNQGEVVGALAWRNHSTYVPVLPRLTEVPPLPVLPGGKQHFSLLGPPEWTTPLVPHLAVPAYQDIHYRLMTRSLQEAPGVSPLPPQWRFREATSQDRDRLFPLQAAYEREEVAFSPEDFQPWACYHHLQTLLETQKIWYITDQDGFPVAKGGTNAQGKDWCQLGGIFTDPSVRRKGVAKALLAQVLAELSPYYRGASLFVKTGNGGARGLYETLGFEDRGEFKISYYQAR